MTIFFIACQNGTVNLKSLDIKVDGISFDSKFNNFSTYNLGKFEIDGLCSKEINQIFFRFDSHSSWTLINTNNGTLDCSGSGKFNLHFDFPISLIKNSTGYTPRLNLNPPKLSIEFYGKTNSYNSNIKTIVITQFTHIKNSFASSAESQINSTHFKMRGKLSNDYYTENALRSPNFQIFKKINNGN